MVARFAPRNFLQQWRRAALAVIILLIAGVSVAVVVSRFSAREARWEQDDEVVTPPVASPTPFLFGAGMPLPSTYRATAITRDGQDVNIGVSAGQASWVIPAQSMQRPGMPAAPLMDWINEDVVECGRAQRAGRLCEPMRWCLQEAAAELAADFRRLLDAAARDLGLRWVEVCPAPYAYADTAGMDCGIGDNAAGCAIYLGPRSGRVSYNANGWRTGWLRMGAITVINAHEYGHMPGNLAHVACTHPEPSNMSPVLVPDGPACAGGRGWLLEDWRDSITRYGLLVGGGGAPPPKPTPPPATRVFAQRWQYRGYEACAPAGGDWCIETIELPGVITDGAWYTLVVVHPDGKVSYPVGFPRVEPAR